MPDIYILERKTTIKQNKYTEWRPNLTKVWRPGPHAQLEEEHSKEREKGTREEAG